VDLYTLLGMVSGIGWPQHLKATDPRDVVYALLGLSSDVEALCIKPDYTKSCRVLYEEVAVALMKRGRNLFPYCTGSDTMEMPSWVPDWRKLPEYSSRRIISTEIFVKFSAGLGKPVTIIYTPGILRIGGAIVDAVGHVMKLPFPGGPPQKNLDFLPDYAGSEVREGMLRAAQFCYFCELSGRLVKNARDSVWRTMVADRIITATTHTTRARRFKDIEWPKFRKMFEAFVKDKVQEYLEVNVKRSTDQLVLGYMEGRRTPGEDGSLTFESDTITPRELASFISTVKATTSRRSICQSRQGHLGLVPERTRPGDFIVIIYGLHTPYILRKVGENFRLLGEAYMHGIMDGEALAKDPQDILLSLC